MTRDTPPNEPTRTAPGYTPPPTLNGLATLAALAALVPLAFLALAHPAPAATLTLAAGVVAAIVADGDAD